jgi:hypothetical protein
MPSAEKAEEGEEEQAGEQTTPSSASIRRRGEAIRN